ncbi:MAG: hypothetical protein K2K07_01725, partial [Lachnospiraceae bacterium]|nr:hypothetical protein [Lachnospiraceae bacterium]
MTVNNVNALLNYTAGQTDPAGMKQDGLAQDSFNQVMAKVSDTISSLRTEAAGNAVNTSAAVQTAGVAATAKTETSASKDAATQETAKKAEPDSGKAEDATGQKDNDTIAEASGTDAEMKQAAEEIEETAKELVQEIAKEMDVTPEEVEEAMAVLGLTAVQLFDNDNLKQLLLQITGSTDELSLVTDEALYGNLQNLLGAVEEGLDSLAKELGMTEDEVSALMDQMIADAGESEAAEAEDMPEVNLEGMKDYTVSVQKDGKTVQVKVTVDDASGNKSVQEEVTDAPKTEVQAGHRTKERNASADSGRGDGSHAGSAFLQTLDKAMETGETPEPVNVEY